MQISQNEACGYKVGPFGPSPIRVRARPGPRVIRVRVRVRVRARPGPRVIRGSRSHWGEDRGQGQGHSHEPLLEPIPEG